VACAIVAYKIYQHFDEKIPVTNQYWWYFIKKKHGYKYHGGQIILKNLDYLQLLCKDLFLFYNRCETNDLLWKQFCQMDSEGRVWDREEVESVSEDQDSPLHCVPDVCHWRCGL
jgi:hypothetical protein